jgi:D-3-phosphoglycerate dehydrogenase
MVDRVLITSRSFRETKGKHWEIIQDAGIEIVDSGVSRALIEDEMVEKMRNVDGALLGVDPVSQRVIETARRLRVISRQGVGFDTVDIKACTERGVIVTTTPNAGTGSVAELAISLIMALLRHIPQSNQTVKSAKWSRLLGNELSEKTVGLIGFGRIAQEVARKLSGFNLRILYYDPCRPSPEVENALNVHYITLNELCQQADIISLHSALNDETRNLINEQTLALMKSSAILVNTARGGLVDEGALAKALRSRRLAGAASDVFVNEPPTGNPLIELDTFIATPHSGAFTAEANGRVAIASAQNLVDGLRGRWPASIVNPEAIENRHRR